MKLLTSIGFLISLFSNLVFSQEIILGQGKNTNITVTTSDATTSGYPTLTSQGYMPNLNASSRFLSQASFGPSFEEINVLASQGIENWIDNQYNTPRAFMIMDSILGYNDYKNGILNTPNDRPYNYYMDFAWWQYMMTSDDVLRQRVTFALMEFFVISRFSSFGSNAYALGLYYDMLMNGAFTNYKSLLDSITYNAAMGQYLTYINNSKTDTIYNLNYNTPYPFDTISIQYVFPDENYAREVMQLFSIGLCELNIDGTCKKDINDVDIPTYDNEDIKEFAKIFTGFSYGDNFSFGNGPDDYELTYLQPMQMYNGFHESGEKYLLNNFTVPNREPVDGLADVQDALNNIFNHPNVGIFFGKFMIQRLVTSNPSSGYIERVAKAFNGESEYGNIRGDMKAFLKAILLDEEARSCSMADNNNHGMLREPFVRYLQLAKAFDLNSQSGRHRNAMSNVYNFIEQKPFSSPSVFNFFQSDYQPIGSIEQANKVAPEFQITNTQSITGYMNGLNDWLFGNLSDQWALYQGEHYTSYMEDFSFLDFTDELALSADVYLPQLLERLNLILAHGKLSLNTTDAIISALKEFSHDSRDCPTEYAGNATEIADCEEDKLYTNIIRVRIAVFLVMASPEYLINR
ncbi:MAG: DUF1800 family protein [Saprospiraceae bacterium]